MSEDFNRISYWLPRIASVLPETLYPQTRIVPYPGDRELLKLLDGVDPDGFWLWIADLDEAARQVGAYPVFLRHDLSSGKHGWVDTCFVPNAETLATHVGNSLDYWYTVNWFAHGGEENWAVREYVPVYPQIMTAFSGMPIGPERRYVISDGKV